MSESVIDAMRKQIERLKAEKLELAKATAKKPRIDKNEKGHVIFRFNKHLDNLAYGQFPVTLPSRCWKALFNEQASILAFIEKHEAKLNLDRQKDIDRKRAERASKAGKAGSYKLGEVAKIS